MLPSQSLISLVGLAVVDLPYFVSSACALEHPVPFLLGELRSFLGDPLLLSPYLLPLTLFAVKLDWRLLVVVEAESLLNQLALFWSCCKPAIVRWLPQDPSEVVDFPLRIASSSSPSESVVVDRIDDVEHSAGQCAPVLRW